MILQVFADYCGFDLGNEGIPDATTLENFRHTIEQNKLGETLFRTINRVLVDHGVTLSQGTIVDASLISAPSSTKNKTQSRDPEMKSTKKGSNYHFGTKIHIGMDKDSKMVHSLELTAANIHDSQLVDKLVRPSDLELYGDSAYRGQQTLEAARRVSPNLRDETCERPYRNRALSPEAKLKNQEKSKVRARVEHRFLILKQHWGYNKIRYRGIEKNRQRLFVMMGLSNLIQSIGYSVRENYENNYGVSS